LTDERRIIFKIGSDKLRQQRDTALVDEQGQRRNGNAEAQGGRQQNRRDAVQYGFCKQGGKVSVEAVLERADNRHSAHAKEHGGGDKTIHKGVASELFRQLAFDPAPEMVKPGLNVERFPDDRTDNEREHHHHRVLRGQRTVVNGKETGQSTAQTNEHHRKADCRKDRLFKAFCKAPLDQDSHCRADNNSGTINERSKSVHQVCLFLYVSVELCLRPSVIGSLDSGRNGRQRRAKCCQNRLKRPKKQDDKRKNDFEQSEDN